MKKSLACLLIGAAHALGLAQTSPITPKPAVKPAAGPATATKPANNTANKSAAGLKPSARKAVEEATPIDDDPSVKLTEADLAMAKQVFVGSIPCELGAAVAIAPMKRDGFFTVTTKGHRFRMHPVESRTGAIRLEDPKAGAMWLQLGNKSMLMSQKIGQRLADECQSPEQVTYADALKKNPIPSIFEPAALPIPVAVPSPVPVPATAATAATAPEPAASTPAPAVAN